RFAERARAAVTGVNYHGAASCDLLVFEGPDIDVAAEAAGEAGAALVGGKRERRIEDGVVAGVDGRAAGCEGVGLCWAAIVGQRPQLRIGALQVARSRQESAGGVAAEIVTERRPSARAAAIAAGGAVGEDRIE